MTPAAITFRGVTKRYGTVTAVDDLTVDVRSGAVTAFLGPNGAGKTTAIRMLLGLAAPNHGEALVFGTPYRDLDRPGSVVGAVIDGAGFHPTRTARNHLRVLAALHGIADRRVDEVLELVDLGGAADRRVGGFSLGMRRRLGLASALLPEPKLLVLDEPANGLDPAGIRWLRESLRSFAQGGGTVFLSSHVLGEVAHTADDAVVIRSGRLVVHTSIRELTGRSTVFVRSPDRDVLHRILHARGADPQLAGRDALSVAGMTAEEVGQAAADAGVVLFELVTRGQDLEDVFLQLTGGGHDAQR